MDTPSGRARRQNNLTPLGGWRSLTEYCLSEETGPQQQVFS